MAKFIVREQNGEFYKALEADDIGSAKYLLWFDGLEPTDFTIEPAPVAEMFTNPDWQEDFNDKRSLHHY